jgi:hypothetical protein
VTWQEYEDAVALLYEQMDDLGTVTRNARLPDRITGQPRQVDVWLEIQAKGHTVGMLVDAKFREQAVDVKDVEEVHALAQAVGANKAVLVTTRGWTKPAARKATFCSMDLRLFTLEDALDLFVPDKWEMCEACGRDCIVLDHDGAIAVEGAWLWWLAGRCRVCRFAFAWCQECGGKLAIPIGESALCTCGYAWRNETEGLHLSLDGGDTWTSLRDATNCAGL